MKDNQDLSVPSKVKKPGLKKTWPAFLILFLALCLSLIGWNVSNEQIKSKLQTLFESENSKIISRISNGIDRQTEVLKSFQLLYKEYSIEVVRDVFELSAAVPIRTYKAIQSISFAPYVLRGGESVFSEYVRNLGYPTYNINPPGPRDEYFPVQYTVPFQSNSCEICRDLLNDENFKETIQKSIDDNQILITYLVSMICSKEPGFLLIAPIYKTDAQVDSKDNRKSNLRGICYIELKAKEFIINALGSEIDAATVSYVISDGSNKGNSSIVYSKPPAGDPLLKTKQTVNVAGKNWMIEFATLPGFAGNVNVSLPWLVLIGGTALSFLLFGFTFSLITSRSRALDLAEKITRSQRRIVDSSQELICVLGFDGLWKNVNPASVLILGYEQEEMINKPLFNFVFKGDHVDVDQAIQIAPDEKPTTLEARFIRKDGARRWINWSITSSKIDQLVYMIGRDITEKKKSDERIRANNRQLDLARIITDRENYKNEEFLRHHSMEFRTELTSIVGFLEIIMSEPGNLNESENEFINLAYASAQSLHNSVKNVLDISYSKISDVSFIYQNFHINDIKKYISILLKDIIDAKKTSISLEFPETETAFIHADPFKLIQCLVVIINNVLEYHKEGKLVLQTVPKPNKGIIDIKLIHTGIKEIPSVFRPSVFMGQADIDQITLNDNEFKVYVAKSFIDVMKGNIFVGLEDNALTFNISLPIEED